MRYFNPLTKEIVSKRDLTVLLNMSVPDGTGKIGDWWLLHEGERPYGFDVDEQRVAEGEIVFADGRYVQTYVLESLRLWKSMGSYSMPLLIPSTA